MTNDGELGGELTCFVIGPIGDRLAPIGTEPRQRYENATQMWENVFEPATAHFGLTPIRADKISEQGEIPEQIFVLLRDSDVVIADLTGGNANVMYELGMRHTRDKMTIQLGEYAHLPFDVNTIRTIQFRRTEAGLIDAREGLIDALRSALTGGGSPVTATRVWSAVPGLDAISVAAVAARSASPEEDDVDVSDTPGLMDILAEGETAIVTLAQQAQRITELMEEYGALAQEATSRVAEADRQRGGFAARLRVAQSLAEELQGPAAELDELSEDYSQQVEKFGAAVDYILGQVESDAGQREDAAEFLANINQLAESATTGNEGLIGLSRSVKNLPKLAKVLAPVSKLIGRGLGRVIAANESVTGWGARIRALPNWTEPRDDAATNS